MARSKYPNGRTPAPKYDPAKLITSGIGKSSFPSIVKCQEEHATRRQRLLRAAKTASKTRNSRAAQRLAKRLENTRRPRKKCSSPLYLRAARRRMVGAILELIERGERGAVTGITLISSRGKFRADQLSHLSARKLIKALRAAFYRAGAAKAEGWLICFLDAEHDPVADVLDFHFHGFASGGMIDVVENLREQRNYGRPRAVRVTRNFKSLARSVNYSIKGHWKSVIRVDGTAGPPRRIPEPTHSRTLLWLDRYALPDLRLMIGVRMDKNGRLQVKKNKPVK